VLGAYTAKSGMAPSQLVMRVRMLNGPQRGRIPCPQVLCARATGPQTHPTFVESLPSSQTQASLPRGARPAGYLAALAKFQGLARAPLDVTEEADGCSSCGPPEICHNETPTDDQADDIVLGAIPPSSASPHFSSVSQPLRRATVFPHTSTSGNF
jgi:hypothetical protein